ncbi:hypothetical protein ACFSKL_07560 [Belliella marina]|uniref:Uncharacterized protein n=1 Tax=Belliella marina TaxID=1644146 RepID=A0ABW4VIV2_9BACT
MLHLTEFKLPNHRTFDTTVKSCDKRRERPEWFFGDLEQKVYIYGYLRFYQNSHIL